MKEELGIYVHIPFCKQKCLYCDFVSFAKSEMWEKEYIQALKKEIEENKEKGYIQPFEEVLAEIKTRDVQDSTRKIAPLQKAEDAIEIVTDSLSAKEVASFICNEIQRNT